MTRRAALSFCFLLTLSSLSVEAVAAQQVVKSVDARPGVGERAVAALLEARPTFNAAGVGLYPFRLEFEARSLAITSHISFGGKANVIRSHAGADLDSGFKVVGALAQARLAVGA